MKLIPKYLYKYLYALMLLGASVSLPFSFISLSASFEDDPNREKSEDPFLGKTADEYLQAFVMEAQYYNVEARGYLKNKGENIKAAAIKVPFEKRKKTDTNVTKTETGATGYELVDKDDPSSLQNIAATNALLESIVATKTFARNLHPDKYKKLSEQDTLRAIVVELSKKYPFDIVKHAINILSQKDSFKDYILTLSKMSSEPQGKQRTLLKEFGFLLKKKKYTVKNQTIELFEEAYNDMAKKLAWHIYYLHTDNFDEFLKKAHRDAEQEIDEARKEVDASESQLKRIQKFADTYIKQKGLGAGNEPKTQGDSQEYPFLHAYILKQVGEMSPQERIKLGNAINEDGGTFRIHQQTSLFDDHLEGRVFKRQESKQKGITFHHINAAKENHFKEIYTAHQTKQLAKIAGVMLLLATVPVGSYIYNKIKERWYDRPTLSLNKDIADLRVLEIRSEQPDNTNLRPYVGRMQRDLRIRSSQLEEQQGNAFLVALLATILLAGGGSAILYTYK